MKLYPPIRHQHCCPPVLSMTSDGRRRLVGGKQSKRIIYLLSVVFHRSGVIIIFLQPAFVYLVRFRFMIVCLRLIGCNRTRVSTAAVRGWTWFRKNSMKFNLRSTFIFLTLLAAPREGRGEAEKNILYFFCHHTVLFGGRCVHSQCQVGKLWTGWTPF